MREWWLEVKVVVVGVSGKDGEWKRGSGSE